MPARPTVILLTLLLTAGAARGDVGLGIEVGWGNVYRAGRWNPVFVTAESSPPREVIAVVEGVTGAPHALTIHNRFALSPAASTHAVFFPFGESYELNEAILTVRDGTTLKRIGATKLTFDPPVQQAVLGQPMIGVSGDGSSFGLLKDQFAGDATLGYLPPPYLPVVAAGYDALDVLMLNSPDLSKISEDQQRPIIDWIRAGGTLILWPGTTATPESGPLISALPATIGDNQLIDLDPDEIARIGWARLARVRARTLTPLPDAQPVPLVGQTIVAYRRSVGLGQIVIAPIDLSLMRFTVPQAVTAFWNRVLAGVPDRTRDGTPDVKTTRWLRAQPKQRTRTIPAWALVALAFIGPVDSLLLKVLGRRPWTVVTVLGWTGLIAAGAVNISRQSEEATTEYRSLRLIEEIDGAAALRTDFFALRPPEGARFDFPDDIARRGAWWRPAVDPTDPPDSPRSELAADQSEGGTWPTALPAHVPTPRVLHAQEWTSAPAVIAASLTVAGDRVTGTLSNRGDKPLTNLRIRLPGGIARALGPALGPGESRQIDAAIDAADRSLNMPPAEIYYDARRSTTMPIEVPDYTSLETLAFQRSMHITRLLAGGDRACVYAEIVDPDPLVSVPAATRQKHLALIRSLIRLDFKAAERPATRPAAR